MNWLNRRTLLGGSAATAFALFAFGAVDPPGYGFDHLSNRAKALEGPSTGSAADAPGRVARAPLYLALGDSLAVGVGASAPADTAFVPLVHDVLVPGPSSRTHTPGSHIGLMNLAMSGATSTTVLADQVPDAVEEIANRRETPSPRDDVRYISVTVGGNDVFALVPVCRTATLPVDPASVCGQAIAATFATFSSNYSTILGELREAAGPRTTIAVNTYYNPLIACQLAPLAPVGDLVLEGFGTTPGLNDLIRGIAAAHDAEVAELHGQLGPTDLVGGSDCLHPNDSGHETVADAFIEAFTTKGPGARAIQHEVEVRD